MKYISLTLITYLLTLPVKAVVDHPGNGKLFDDSLLHKIEITIDPDDLEFILENIDSDEEFPATAIFHHAADIDTVENIGFRLKGNLSRTNDKKPFKISFNTFEPGKKYKGVEKLNLHANWNDPTQIRCHLASHLFMKMGVAISRSSFCELYINGDPFGVYNIFEHIDEEFTQDRFGNGSGDLYKCLYPASLQWEGSNQDAYKAITTGNDERAYDLRSSDGSDDYSRFVELLDIVNNTSSEDLPCELEPIFNVADYLKVIAVDVAIGNWDGYIYNENNFYLYDNPLTGKFEFIPYDFDNSFGIDWVGRDWATRNVYNWSKGNNNRPLYDKLLEVEEYRNLYTYYLSELSIQLFNLDYLQPQIDHLQQLLAGALDRDEEDNYDFDDTQDAYDLPLNTGWNSYSHLTYGLTEYITTRSESILNQIEAFDSTIAVNHADFNHPLLGDSLKVKVRTEGLTPINVTCYLNIDGQGYQPYTLPYDGVERGIFLNQREYQLEIEQTDAALSSLEWYFEVTDENQNTYREPCEGSYSWLLEESDIEIVINELSAVNNTIKHDGFGEYDDWLELYNAGTAAVDLSQLYLSDNPADPTQWNLPAVTLAPGEFILIWADKDGSQGETHANFKLSGDGETIVLYAQDGDQLSLVDQMTYLPFEDEGTVGYYPDAEGELKDLTFATPGYSNLLASRSNTPTLASVHLYPNPASSNIHLDSEKSIVQVSISSITGAVVMRLNATSGIQSVDISQIPNGMYWVNWVDEDGLGSVVKMQVVR